MDWRSSGLIGQHTSTPQRGGSPHSLLSPARTKVLTGIFEPPILAKVMSSTRTFLFFAFTYRSFFFKESGPAKFENDVLKT